MSVERRDLTVPTNSVVCSTGLGSSVTISTAMAGIAGGVAPPEPPAPSFSPPHAAAANEAETRARNDSVDYHMDVGQNLECRW